MRGVLANRHRTADTPNLAAQGQSVSRKTVAEVPLTGLSFGVCTGALIQGNAISGNRLGGINKAGATGLTVR
jgi:hypothetical protein